MNFNELRKSLKNPDIYPERPNEIKEVETHLSVVFLTGTHAYKIKKAVDFGFLDYTTLEKRRYFCEKEVELNRRLSQDIYIGVVSINEKNGVINIDGKGDIVEYAVKMIQIPEERIMDRLLSRGLLTKSIINEIARRLFCFYTSSETSDYISSFARPERIKEDTDENFKQTLKYIDVTISRETYEKILNGTNNFLEKRKALFLQRIGEGRIRDCHGDLRLSHICLMENDIMIIDCIEFNERFRYLDIASDMAFLAMDLDYHDRPDLSQYLIDTYVNISGDKGLLSMLNFYKAYRAYVRGKVDSFCLDDPYISKGEKENALKRAKRYFSLSFEYINELFKV